MLIQPEMYVLANTVVQELPKGRVADAGVSLPALGEMVRLAGHGDHVETGCLFGASAIMAALVKERYTLGGQVYTIDPFEPRDVSISEEVKEAGLAEGNIEAVLENAEHFKVSHRLAIVKQRSYPWPGDLKDHAFTSGYIDGNHIGLMPWFDFLSMRDRVRMFIGFDNFEENYPDVMTAALRATTLGGWILHYKSGIFMSLRRPVRMPEREKFKTEREFTAAGLSARDWSLI